MPPPAADNRFRVLLVALAGLAVLVFLFADGQKGESPEATSRQSPALEGSPLVSDETSPPADSDAAPADEGLAGEIDDPEFGALEAEFDSQPSNRQALASGSGGDDSPTAREIQRAIERAQAIQRLEAGGRAARNNPTRPPAIEKALNTARFVPPEIQEAANPSGDTPPEILAAKRERRGTPPEIARALAEAAERGTSDAMRAYMAGETDQRPAY